MTCRARKTCRPPHQACQARYIGEGFARYSSVVDWGSRGLGPAFVLVMCRRVQWGVGAAASAATACIFLVFTPGLPAHPRTMHWLERDRSDAYRDLFDGSQFSEHRDWIRDKAFDLSLCLMINIDWWQKFKRTVHSLGGIYSSILNLPRDIRQKLDNIFTLGMCSSILILVCLAKLTQHCLISQSKKEV